MRENLGVKFPSTSLGYSVVRVFFLNDIFLRIMNLKQATYKAYKCSKKIKGAKCKGEKNEIRDKKPRHTSLSHLKTILSQNFDWCASSSECNASGNEGNPILSCIVANLAHINAEMLEMSKLSKNVTGLNGRYFIKLTH